MAKGKVGRPKLPPPERPHIPVYYLRVLEGYKGRHYDGALSLVLDVPGPLFAPCDMQLVDYFQDKSGEVLILQSKSRVSFADKSTSTFTMMLKQSKTGDFLLKNEYLKEESLGYIAGSNLCLEVAKGQYSGYSGHLYNTIRADNLFICEGSKCNNHGQPLISGEPLKWKDARAWSNPHKKERIHVGDRVYTEFGPILDESILHGEPCLFLKKLDSFMGKDYLRIKNNKAKLLPSIVADIRTYKRKRQVLVNGFWIDEKRLKEIKRESEVKNKHLSLPCHQPLSL